MGFEFSDSRGREGDIDEHYSFYLVEILIENPAFSRESPQFFEGPR